MYIYIRDLYFHVSQIEMDILICILYARKNKNYVNTTFENKIALYLHGQ